MSKEPAWDCYGASDLGQRRTNNEDRFLTAEIGRSLVVRQTNVSLRDGKDRFGVSQGHLLVIADGLGGHPGGEYASETVVNVVGRHVLTAMPCLSNIGGPECGIYHELRQALKNCQAELDRFAQKHPDYDRLGTTLTVALVLWPRLYVLHVGDSRCYVLHEGELGQVTTDETLVQQLVDNGALEPEKAEKSPWAHVLVNAVEAAKKPLPPQLVEKVLTPGDAILMCTDGLSGNVPPEELARALGASDTAQKTCENLIQKANDAGGSDNITVIVAKTAATDE